MNKFDSIISMSQKAIALKQYTYAKQLLVEAIEINETSEIVWWLLSTIIDDPAEQEICLMNVLDINPAHEEAKKNLFELNVFAYVYHQLASKVDMTKLETSEVLPIMRTAFYEIIQSQDFVMIESEQEELFYSVVFKLIGMFPLSIYLNDDEITGIYVKDLNMIKIEKNGKWFDSDQVHFDNTFHLKFTAEYIVAPFSRLISEKQSNIDTRLVDGSSVNIVLPPTTIKNHIMMIRKFARTPLSIMDLLGSRAMSESMAEFLRAWIIAKLNVLVIGYTGSGKTYLLNTLSEFIPNDERIVTVERVAEFQLQQEHVVSLECSTHIPVDQLLDLDPGRIFYGEILQNDVLTFVDTSLCVPTYATMRATDINAALRQLELGILTTIPDIDLGTARRYISSALDLIVQLKLFPDGNRTLVEIVEVNYNEDGEYSNRTLFVFEINDVTEDKIIGRHVSKGNIPNNLNKIVSAGINLPHTIFTPD